MRMIRPAEDIRRDLRNNPELAELYAQRKELAEYWRTHFSDSPDLISGWGHNAVCPSCTEPLRYDRESPHAHVCTKCGEVHDSQIIREAWNASRRHDILNGLNAAALVYDLEGGEQWRDFILDTLGWYADQYAGMQEHGIWVGLGKMMGHTLDEAIWGINALKALIIAQIDPMDARAQHIKHGLLVPMARQVLSQPCNLMNIALWHAALATGVGVYYKDHEFTYPQWKPHRVGAEDPFGFTRLTESNGARLLLENITPDGLWRENSMSYHYYALSAAMEFFTFVQLADFDTTHHRGQNIMKLMQDKQISRTMLDAFLAPLKLLYPNGDMPATSDGWKYSLGSVAHQYVRALYLCKDAAPEERALLAAVVHAAGTPKATPDALMYGIPENPKLDLIPRESLHFTHNRMAMLHDGDTHLFFKYGNLCAGHSHPDALELSIYPIAVDPGSLSYGAPIHGEYFYVGGSHSTFMIDGEGQYNGACGTAQMDADGLGISGEIDDAFPGVKATRKVRINGTTITDRMDITCDTPRQMDWLFHGSGDFVADGTWEPAELPEKTHGFKHFANARKLADRSDLHVQWTFEGYQLALDMPAIRDAAFYVAETPDNPTTRTRHAVIVRKHGTALAVPAEFTLTKL